MRLDSPTIVSGGQTGVDRAALDAAIAAGLAYAGWTPRGGWAEDLPDPPGLLGLYPDLRACAERHPAARTRLNVKDSDATLLLWPRPGQTLSRGTALTLAACRQAGRPRLMVDPAAPNAAEEIAGWRAAGAFIRINVAGPRESQAPGVYQAARVLLDPLFAAWAAY